MKINTKNINITISEFPILLFLSIVFLWTFIILIILLPHGKQSEFTYCCGNMLSVMSTNAQLQDYFGYSDAGSYARGGLLLYQTGTELSTGGAPQWAPGMFWVHALLLKAMGISGPVALGMVIISGFAWAIFCALLSTFAYRVTQQKLALAIPSLFFMIPAVSDYLLKIGLFFSETISFSILGCAFLLSAEAFLRKDDRFSILAGLLFALAGYFRASFEITFHPIAMAGFFLISVNFFINKYIRIKDKNNIDYISFIRVFIIIVTVFYSLTIPYRIKNYISYNRASWDFTDYYFEYPWMQSSEYSQDQGFVLNGGGNIACRVDPVRCADFEQRRKREGRSSITIPEYKEAFFQTLIARPIAWFNKKTPYFTKFWFSRPTFGQPVVDSFWPGIITAIFVLLTLTLSIFLFFSAGIFWPLAFSTGYLGGSTLLIYLVHIEARYMYLFQVMSPVLFIITVAPLMVTRRNK